jgi:ATP-dependent DNA helicase RecQ
VGSIKLSKYGQVFLDVISGYCQEHKIVTSTKPVEMRREGSLDYERRRKYFLVGEAFNAGASIQELMRRFGVTQGTILKHLSSCIQEGFALRSNEFLELPDLPGGVLSEVMQAFQALGPGTLKPVYDQLNGRVNYDDLRLLRLHYLTSFPET